MLVTGAGSGIGSVIALRFAQAGAKVVVHFHSSEEGARTIVERIRSSAGEAVTARADVTRREEVERLIEETVSAFGALDVLINNAGTYPVSALLEMKDREWDEVLAANLRSVHLCTQGAARQMARQGKGGAIVNIASIEAENPAHSHAHYNAAKAGVAMYTRSAALELGGHGIRVNCVSPGLIWTEGLEEAWPDGIERYLAKVPLGRLGMPQDVADACLFLASPAARWISGANLLVDGGVLTNTAY